MPFVTSEGANIFLEMEGEGVPLLFSHDFGMDHRQWDAQAATLSGAHAVYRFDWHGHGQSAATARRHTTAAMSRDLVRIMVQVGMEKAHPGFLVASGWSAPAAVGAVLGEPRLLRGVVLVSPEVPGHAESPERQALWQDVRSEVAAGRVAAAFERYRRDARFDRLRDRPDVFAAIHAMHGLCTAASLVEPETAPDVVTQLANAKVPILVLAGEHDREEFRSTARAIAAAAPAGELHVLDGNGHFSNLEAPATFDARLVEFMTRLTPAH